MAFLLLPKEMFQEITRFLTGTEVGLLRMACKHLKNSIKSDSRYCKELIAWSLSLYCDHGREYEKRIYHTLWGRVQVVWVGKNKKCHQMTKPWNVINAEALGIKYGIMAPVKSLKRSYFFRMPDDDYDYWLSGMGQITIWLNGIKRFTLETDDMKNYWTNSKIQTEYIAHCNNDNKEVVVMNYRTKKTATYNY